MGGPKPAPRLLVLEELESSEEEPHDGANGGECDNPRKERLKYAKTSTDDEANQISHEVNDGGKREASR